MNQVFLETQEHKDLLVVKVFPVARERTDTREKLEQLERLVTREMQVLLDPRYKHCIYVHFLQLNGAL